MDGVQQAFAAVNNKGGRDFDPVRHRYIEALLRRAKALPEPVAVVIRQKAEQAIQQYNDEFAAAVEAIITTANNRPEQAAVEQYLQQGDFIAAQKLAKEIALANKGKTQSLPRKSLQRLSQRLTQQQVDEPEHTENSLAAVMQRQERNALEAVGASVLPTLNSNELKSMAGFRHSWQKARATKLADDITAEAPENPGPLNQHMLVIRALEKMRQLSPAFFDRYSRYMGSVMWLQNAKLKPKKRTSKSAHK